MLVIRAQTELWEPPHHRYHMISGINNTFDLKHSEMRRGGPEASGTIITFFALFALWGSPGWWTLCVTVPGTHVARHWGRGCTIEPFQKSKNRKISGRVQREPAQTESEEPDRTSADPHEAPRVPNPRTPEKSGFRGRVVKRILKKRRGQFPNTI